MKSYKVYWRMYGETESTFTIVPAFNADDAKAALAKQNPMIQIVKVELEA